VLSPLTALYFDNPQEPDPEDWGLHWATRYVDTRRAFRFAPESMYDSIDEEFYGQPTSKHKLCDTRRIHCVPLEHPENILGKLSFSFLQACTIYE
jgi:hexosaminidase